VDATCSAERGAALLQLVLDVVDRCMTLIDRGVAATELEEFDFGTLVRAREEAPDLSACRIALMAALEALP
jgi:V/A-type H+-transporting ATPase subunit A